MLYPAYRVQIQFLIAQNMARFKVEYTKKNIFILIETKKKSTKRFQLYWINFALALVIGLFAGILN